MMLHSSLLKQLVVHYVQFDEPHRHSVLYVLQNACRVKQVGVPESGQYVSIKRAAPEASRVTKALLHRTLNEPLSDLLDDAAQQ
jgi:hypothetical protein